jgi:dTDP-4-dehydrorhamnose reductase
VIVVTGGSGQLGTAFRRLLPDASFPDRHTLDLTTPHRLAGVLDELSPTAIINCAAYTAVDRAESEPEVAMRVNAESVGVMAEFAARRSIPFLTFSTDYVFDGESPDPYVESSPTNPINQYGRSKLAGEEATLAAHPEALVVRTSWVLSGTHRNFVTAILKRAREQGARVVNDQRGCPTVVSDLAPASLAAWHKEVTGILHLTNTGATTWFDLATEAATLAGFPASVIEPIGSDEYPTAARRPRNSVLASERLGALGLPSLPHWRDSLPALVHAQESLGLTGG